MHWSEEEPSRFFFESDRYQTSDTMDDVSLAPRQDLMPDNEYTFIVTAAIASFLAQLISIFLDATFIVNALNRDF